MLDICNKRNGDIIVCYKPDAHSFNIGKFEIWRRPDRDEIWALGVHSDYRNKGYATKMLTEFLSAFKSERPLVLYVYKDNEIAIRLYEKVGFVIIGDHRGYAYTMQYRPA